MGQKTLKGGIVLLADDLTGACDVGAAAGRRGWRVRCVLASAPGWEDHARPRPGEAVVIDLETRRLTERAAVRRAAGVARWLLRHRLRPAYFKIDSTLRGHPVAEAATVRRVGRLRRIWFVPANPAMGRTVRDGRLLVHGVAVERTAFARDPLHPIRSGDVPRLTRSLRAGGGCGAPDVRTARDLARTARRIEPGDLVVGAAALANWVIPRVPRAARRNPMRRRVRANGRVLAVIGSMNPVTARQVAQASRAEGVRLLHLGPQELRRSSTPFTEPGPGVRLLALDGAKFRRVLGGSPERRRVEGERIAAQLARLAARVIRRWRPGTLMLSGGLTAAAVCEALRVRSLSLVAEPAPGIVRSQAVWPGGSAAILTKPGGFGGPAALRHLAGA